MFHFPTNGERNHCPTCGQQYEETNMVECTSCKRWIHFRCANVSEEVQDDPNWICSHCENNIEPQPVAEPYSNIKNQLSTSKDTKQKVSEKPSGSNITKLSAPENKLYKLQHDIEVNSHIPSISSKTSKRRLQLEKLKLIQEQKDLVKQQLEILEEISDMSSETSFQISKRDVPAATKSELINKFLQSSHVHEAVTNCQNDTVKQYDVVDTSISQPDLQGKLLKGIEKLVNKQNLPNKLPNFTGRPDEWPVFISSYEYIAKDWNDATKIVRLSECLHGTARTVVESMLTTPQMAGRIIEVLTKHFGRPEHLIEQYIMKVKQMPSPNEGDLQAIIELGVAIQNLCVTMEQTNQQDQLVNPQLKKDLLTKLPTSMQLQWAAYRRSTNTENSIKSLGEWLEQIVDDLSSLGVSINKDYSQIKYEPRSSKTNNASFNKKFVNRKESVNVHNDTVQKSNNCIVCKNDCSEVLHCKKFKEMSLKNKWDVVKMNHLCNRCLKRHKVKCEKSIPCQVSGCEKLYHPILHKHIEESLNVINNFNINVNNSKILFRMIPVVLINEDKQIKTYAFLDEGSSTTLITDELSKKLNLKEVKEPFCMKWTSDVRRFENDSSRVSLSISGTYKNAPTMKLTNARTVKSLNLPTQNLNYAELCDKFHYIKNLPIESYEKANPQILIGQANWKLAVPVKSKFSDDDNNGPIAVKCKLGWTICSSTNITEQISTHYDYNFHICECEQNPNTELTQMIKEHFSVESLGISAPKTMSQILEEERAKQLILKQTKQNGNRYTTGLLWRQEEVKLPNSKPMATQRLKCFERKLNANPQLAEIVKQQIRDYLQKGYIRKLTEAELNEHHDKIWYLPVFTVQNPNKPEKVRLVWDAKATVNGISLNSVLLKGVDINSSLLGVLLRSRERKVCICADIAEMFHRIEINAEDQHVLRFLWRENENCEPDTYVMNVMAFGTTCSPYCAQYVKNKHSMKFINEYPRATTCIIQNHYVDDLLDSVDTVEEAIQLGNDVKMIQSKAGFDVRKWKSNSIEVMKALNDNNDNELKVNMNPEVFIEKILGMWWNLENDCYTFSLKFNKGNHNVLNGTKIPTKREIMQVLMSIYDPMGLVEHYKVYLKILLQDIWRSQIDWDDSISNEQFQKWLTWLKYLPMLEKLNIPRCYLQSFKNWSELNVQLHVFTDAGEDACACIAYLRLCSDEKVECIIVSAKSKVAPLKIKSIPRLELDAALMGSRMSKEINEQLSIKIHETIYWTDSKVVLNWIKSGNTKYSKYVSFRTSEIQEITLIKNWRYIPSKINIADIATKWVKPPKVQTGDIWFKGPQFLLSPENKWPKNIEIKESSSEERCHVIKIEPPIIDYERFSSFKKLLNVVGYIRKFMNVTNNKHQRSNQQILNCEDLSKAKIMLLQMVQREVYDVEIKLLKNHKQLKSSSHIYKLSPFVDEDGLLKIDSRLARAEFLNNDTKKPIILPRSHYLTKLIVKKMHIQYLHQNHETVVNQLRQTFYIPKMRRVLKTVRSECGLCKIRNARPIVPKMSALPYPRLGVFTEAFTYVGIDCFGPMNIKIGRRIEKRWGALFTCLTTRAVHIEVLHNMDGDSFIMCIRNFTARRGTPREIFSDNGTNFIKTERILREEYQSIDFSEVAKEFISAEMKWNFNPPTCAHMGGAWEILVKAFKKAMYASLPTKTPTEASLNSCLIAAEGMINSRPLTYLPLDSEEGEALTPFHFIGRSTSGVKPIGIMDDSAKNLKYNYQCLEQFANRCWKWHEKTEQVKVGDIVLIIDSNMPRNNYPKGRIIQVFPAVDGQIRRARVQTENSICERPVSKLAVLRVEDQ